MFEDLAGLIVVAAFVAAFVLVVRQSSRLGLLERELGALRSLVLSQPMAGFAGAADPAPRPAQAASEPPDTISEAAAFAAPAQPAELLDPVASVEPETVQAPAVETPAVRPALEETAAAARAPGAVPPVSLPPHSPQPPRRPDIETALGTRWAVWVGGVALALGGLFLVRYTIESGFFGPAARLTLAGLLGILLMAAGEFIRRTGYKLPLDAAAGAYIPAILTAAGSFTLFGTVYSAHGIYGFIGPALAFPLLGMIGVGTMALALIHGRALAGIGLLGALATPILIASNAPNAWALFGYLAIVLVTTTAIARIRNWRFLPSAAYVGIGIYTLAYMVDATPDLWVLMFISFVQLGNLALIWIGRFIPLLGGEPEDDTVDVLPAAVPALFNGLVAIALVVDPAFRDTGGTVCGTILLLAMIAVAAWRIQALPLLFGAGIATALTYLRIAFVGGFAFEVMGEPITVDGFPVDATNAPQLIVGIILAAVFLAAGIWRARALVALRPLVAACWTFFAALSPLMILLAIWLSTGNPDRDLGMAAFALLLGLALAAGGEMVARAEAPPLSGGLAVTFALSGAGIALLFLLHMAFGPAPTTILLGFSAIVPALATRLRSYKVLGGLSVAAAIATLVRIAVDPTIVGAQFLSTTPVFNALLPGYGIPAIAFAFSAWQLAHTTDGRPRLAMEAAAALFALLTAAMLVRHAMNGGVIDSAAPSLAEQAIYSLIALGAGGILIALDMRAPSSVFRYGSIAIGVLSVATIGLQHVLFLNPLFTEESTGKIPVFNLLLLAYLLPAIAAGALAWYARNKRPQWYSAMLALAAAVLAFTYATLSVRRVFKGEFIGLWSGLGQLETYSYSALWLAMGVVLLVIGVRTTSMVLRLSSAALISIAVAKVFLFDMSELEGVLRALSFIGLGAVLIGIGLFYQRLLTRAAR